MCEQADRETLLHIVPSDLCCVLHVTEGIRPRG